MNEKELYDSLWNRSRLLFNDDNRAKLKQATVAIAGLGGIGCGIAEMLVRTGVGHFKLADPGSYGHREAAICNYKDFRTKQSRGSERTAA